MNNMTIAQISGTFFWNSILYCVKALKPQHGYIEEMFIIFVSVNVTHKYTLKLLNANPVLSI